MDRAAALEQLKSSGPHERLRAARFLAKYAASQDLPMLRGALRDETVSWVKKALGTAIDKLAAVPQSYTSEESSAPDLSDSTVRQMHTKAVEEVTGTILHEFQPIIGVLKLRAVEEVQNYETSGVKTQLDRLDRLITGIEGLRRAAAAPKRREFDLAELVHEISAAEVEGKGIEPSFVGPKPLLTEGDPDLLRLAISNGLRNAIDAVTALPKPARDYAIIINWDATDIETWLVIIDKGRGLATGAQGAFNVGTTTKKDHSGMGLPIARQAMESMEGEISLTPGKTPAHGSR
jgi:signal transduction histidine kinase